MAQPHATVTFQRIAAAASLSLLLLASSFSGLSGHQQLIRAEPASASRLGEAPRILHLHFQEAVELSFSRVEVFVDGRMVRVGELRLGDAATELIVPLPEPLSGNWIVRWSTAGGDGHPVRGEYTFSVAGSGPGGEAGATSPAPGAPATPHQHHEAADAALFSADSPVYVFIRWVGFLALVCLIGTVVFATIVLRSTSISPEYVAEARRGAAWLGVTCAVLLLLAGSARLLAQSLAMHGPPGVLDGSMLATLLAGTTWGWGWILQMCSAVAALVGFVLVRRGRASGWWLAGVAATALAVTPALSGHAAAMRGAAGAIAVLNDTVHVAAAGAWLGTLFVLVVVGLRRLVSPAHEDASTGGSAVRAADLVSAFSPVALVAAGLLLLSGTLGVIIHSESLPALIASRYGRILLLKMGAFSVVIGLGAYNFKRLSRRLNTPAGAVSLRRSASLELGAGAVVLLATALLVATARPSEDTSSLSHAASSETEQTP